MMNMYFIEFIFVNLLLFFLFSIYQMIKQRINFLNRRIILLILPILSILGGILNYQLNSSNTESFSNLKLIRLNLITITNNTTETIETHTTPILNYWWYIFLLGAVVSLLISFYKIFKIFTFYKTTTLQKFTDYNLIVTNHQQNFSFLNFIHLSAQLDENERKIVLEHELIHVKKKHSLDLILMEFYQALFWYNPLLLFMKKELIIVHEFEVDEQMFNKHGNMYISNLLNQALGSSSSQLVLTSQFFKHTSLAKRTKIMKQKSKKTKWIVVIIPVSALLLTLVSFSKINSPVNPYQENIELVPKDSIYDAADVDPEFPGGQEVMQKFIAENFHLSEKAKKEGKEGMVYTQFVVNKKGEITNVETLKGVSPEVDEECIRVIESMPRWTPGEINGKKVSVKFIIPMNVMISKDE